VLPKLLGPYERNQIEAIKWTSMLLPHESVVKKFCYFLSYQCPFSTPVKQQFEVQNININHQIMNEYIPNTNTYFHAKAKVKEDRKINYIYIFSLDFHNMSLFEDIL
jgi:hypothetical protein